MTRKAWFWILLCLASISSLWVTIAWFDRAFPVVTLDFRMDRASALERAASFAEERGLGPDGYSQAASFRGDQAVQNYAELEVGPDGLRRLLDEGLYPLYRWTVRHYREGEITESRIFFRPDGSPSGFRLDLPEAAPGAALQVAEARTIATAELSRWREDPESWALVEERTESRSGGRVDHRFIWEFEPEGLGEARFRILIGVAGDRVHRVEPVMRLPEGFGRRYQELRSANNTLALAAGLAVGLLYLLVGCGGGLLYLLRRRALRWRPALLWGSIVGGLQFLVGLNEFPLIWMGYDTALGASQFLFRWVLQSLGEGMVIGAVLGVIFMVAEGLGRLAFPGQLRIWGIWGPTTGTSTAVLGQTLAGYLLVPVLFCYETGLYFATRSRLDWWSPSDSLIHPDSLAGFLPWLSPIAFSLQAGLGEEALFRAVPLAGAVLLGRRFGRTGWWVLASLLLQAVIFGAAHANYATQPFYARMVELILPSFLFGALYLAYGLLPSVILHFAFNVVWFALPVFMSSSGSVADDRLMVVLLAFIPLWVVLYRWLRAGRIVEVPESALNRAWSPDPVPATTPSVRETGPAPPFPPAWRSGLALAGLAVLGLTVLVDKPGPTVPRVDMDRGQAESRAEAWIRSATDPAVREFAGDAWTLLSRLDPGPDPATPFIWETGGADRVGELLGRYLAAPAWVVRLVRFDVPAEERAEELILRFSAGDEAPRMTHVLPEARPGAVLDREAAEELARQAIAERYPGVVAAELVAVEPVQLPSRRDWSVVFEDPAAPELLRGQKRIQVRISGDRVVDLGRFVFVPEEWFREQRNRQAVLSVIAGACGMVVVLVLVAGSIWGLAAWSRGRFDYKALLSVGALGFGAQLVSDFSRWETRLSYLSTAEPYLNQVGSMVATSLASATVVGLLIGFSAGLLRQAVSGPGPRSRWSETVWAFAFLSGVGSTPVLLRALLESGQPPWPDLSGADTWSPVAAGVAGSLLEWIASSCFLALVMTYSGFLRLRISRWRRLAFLVSMGAAAGGAGFSESLVAWGIGSLTGAILMCAAEAVVHRTSLGMVAILAAIPVAAPCLRIVIDDPYPAAVLSGFASLCGLVVASWGALRMLRN